MGFGFLFCGMTKAVHDITSRFEQGAEDCAEQVRFRSPAPETGAAPEARVALLLPVGGSAAPPAATGTRQSP